MTSVHVQQAPGFYRIQVGDAVVTALSDGYIDIAPEWMKGVDAAEVAAMQHEVFRPALVRSSVNAYLVQTPGRTVMIDTGTGNLMGPTLGKLPASLAAAGTTPAEIDVILLTHIHPDHAGGMLDAGGAVVFPNAEVLVSAAEAKHWLDTDMATLPDEAKPFFQAAHAVATAYGERFRPFEGTQPLPGVDAVPLHGHTPGHTGYRVGELFIWGDVFHMPDLQSRRPEIAMVFDVDSDAAIATRRRVLDMAATDRLMVAGGHMHFPAFAHIARAGGAYAVVPVPWTPVLG